MAGCWFFGLGCFSFEAGEAIWVNLIFMEKVGVLGGYIYRWLRSW